ncbi:MAG: aldehyde dehydrogenase family protein [Pigmentiphaga sp.]|uniref:aldehyde dehydrogenase family protein n=1 Tax=Pigmentiphaga sp. TaxID=1977564 RepID=UPI0029B4A45D|nr:aldehyde dehydrogenase family protein [Pigmentiphaga sp.]MDX3907814.1 aldehyde dehydrogenase family protein [Pigmentiphaga sp.]
MKGRLLIEGAWVDGASVDVLRDKYRGNVYGEMAVASPGQVDQAVASAARAVAERSLSPYQRYRILLEASRIIAARAEPLMELLRDEAGFTRADGQNEVSRCVQTLELAAEEAKRLQGELVPMQAADGIKRRMGFTLRFPLGVVCAITPFNSPLNIVAHKIAPALAGGNAVIIKPSELAPLGAVALCEALLDAGLPPERLSLVHGDGTAIGTQLLADPRIAFYAFTGSTRVGRIIQREAGLRKTQLELGSIASTLVCHDADIDTAIPKILNAGLRKAGQVCTSTQMLFVDRRIAGPFQDKLLAAARTLRYGDPADPATDIGPMISAHHAQRAQAWINEAVAAGATLLLGGHCEGTVLAPTILTNVAPHLRVRCEEIFAPVISLITYDDLDAALAQINGTPFGLSVGCFTANLHQAFDLAHKLRFGGIHINEASSARVDAMPFGGVKDSGFGREGPAYAIREMTEERLVTIAY